MVLGVTERSGIRDTSRAILVVGNHVRLAVIQTTFTVAAVPLERSADAKDRRDPTPHRGQAAARSQGPPKRSPRLLLLLSRAGPLQNGIPSLPGQTLPRDGGFPDAAKAPDCGLERVCKHGAKPRSFKVAPSVTPGRGP